MERLISLFANIEHDLHLSRQDTVGPPVEPPRPDYEREPEYFRHLLDYLRDRKQAGEADELIGEPAEEVLM